MGLTEYALSQALLMALNHVNKSDIVVKTAHELDLLADQRLGISGSEKVQERIVTQILLPIAKELLKENPSVYATILSKERNQLVGGGQLISGELGPIPRPGQETQAQNFVPKVRGGTVHDG